MLDIKYIRENSDFIKKSSRNKKVDIDIDRLLEIDKKRRKILQSIENMRAQKNRANEEMKETGDKKKEEIIKKMRLISEKENEANKEFKKIDDEFQYLIRLIPNPAFKEVPVGKDDSQNVVLREVGKRTEFDFEPRDYLSISEELDLIDIKRAAKVSGSRFGYLKNEAALIQFALIEIVLKITSDKNFIPIIPPVMINPEMMEKMGYIRRSFKDPKEWEGDEVYFLKNDDLLLVGTSEQSIGPMHADEILKEEELPKRYIGFSSCFRREAGSYGKDTKGILRVHQFEKLEMFSFCLPENSKKEHELLLSIEEDLMQKLNIPYRVINICTGDLGDPAAKKYDIEAWMPGQNQYRETHSTSNCTDFQSRRLNIRYKNTQGKIDFIHMLNGTALPIGRILIAIIENYQQKDGSVQVPEVLQKYIGKSEIKKSGT